jgi:hypothetical protein
VRATPICFSRLAMLWTLVSTAVVSVAQALVAV